jgi:hypothetical protein
MLIIFKLKLNAYNTMVRNVVIWQRTGPSGMLWTHSNEHLRSMKDQLNEYQIFMTASLPCRHLISVFLSSMRTVWTLKETLPVFSSETVYVKLSIYVFNTEGGIWNFVYSIREYIHYGVYALHQYYLLSIISTKCNVTQISLLPSMLYMFQAVYPPIFRSSKLYTHLVYVKLACCYR